MAEKLNVRVGAGKIVPLSNPKKELFPGFTKLQVLNYYVAASRYFIPHLKQRPVSLKRFPDGIHGVAFWEKNAPAFTPDWVETFPVPRKKERGEINYILVNDVRTVAWCAAIAAIEFHPFLHTTSNLDRPTSIVYDLDPGEGADILTCARVAFDLKKLLEGFGLRSFPKVSGSKGLQIYVPLNSPVSYVATRAFARMVAQTFEREQPKLVVSEMSKTLRRGKVFIDWSQNIDTKTTVAVYSLRAKHDTPYVSMPVQWEELKEAMDGGKQSVLYFEPDAALKRLAKLGDLFEPVLKLKQRLPKLEAIKT
jgi:bifunctional non-homologous end joining protein LigD